MTTSEVVEGLFNAVRDRTSHTFVVSGNIYDKIGDFDDFQALLGSASARKFSNLLCYDLFSGLNVIRGDKDKLAEAMGFKKKPASNDPATADLIAALKKNKPQNPDFPVDPEEAFFAVDKLFESDEPSVFMIDHADTVFFSQLNTTLQRSERALQIALIKWARSPLIRQKGHLVVLLTRHASDLPERIRDRVFGIREFRIPKPSQEDRFRFFEERKYEGGAAHQLSMITGGLAFRELEQLVPEAITPDMEALLKNVFAAKRKILSDEYGDLLDIMETRNGFDCIGGLEGPIAKLRLVAHAMREGKTSLVPQGVLFMGPPGTGKTVLAEALAKEAGLNFVRPLDIKSMWLGESERRMSKFLNAIKDLAPVVVFIDEFDQNQGQRGGFDGDSGVSKGLFKKMLEIMSDTSLRGKVLWILATNRPDLIDPAMKRAGRCDLRIAFLPPDEKQLLLIVNAAFRQFPEMAHEISDWTPYVKRCQGYNGADMIEVIRRAWERASYDGREKIKDKDMDWACQDYRPQVLDRRTVALMTLISIAECSSESLLPENFSEVRDECLTILENQNPRDEEKSDKRSKEKELFIGIPSRKVN